MLQIDFSEFREVVADLQHDVDLLKDLEEDRVFIEAVREAIKDNFREVWSTQGTAIGEDWSGRTLVKTGNLRSSLTTDRLKITITRQALIFSSDASYGRYVNELYRWAGISPRTQNKINDAVGEVLRRKGKLTWRTT